MSWLYVIKTGKMFNPDGSIAAQGYSGDPVDKNNPLTEGVADEGPIPEGLWQMIEWLDVTKSHGPDVIALSAYLSTDTHGRSGFLIHGDSVKLPGTASKGCIIMPRPTRLAMWQSADHDLRVIAEQVAVPDLDGEISV